jgi:hypothetical protein
MALKGTLRDFSLADIFQLIGIQRKTGVLTLKDKDNVVTVSFVDGSVVAAESQHRRLEDRIGTVLVKTGRITGEQLQDALKIQKETLNRLGNVLVDKGLIDVDALRDALQIQITQTIYRLFRWQRGEYDFSQETRVDYDKKFVVPLSAESVLMEGARILDEWPMIEKGIRSFSSVYRRADVEIAAARQDGSTAAEEAEGAITLSEEERVVHALVDGKRTVQEVVEHSLYGEFETCRILYELINRHLLEEVRTRTPQAAPVKEAAPRQRLAPVVQGIAYLLLILVAGGAVFYRLQPWLFDVRQGKRFAASLSPVLGSPDVGMLDKALATDRLHQVDFALQVYYLLYRAYPPALTHLVSANLLKQEDLLDSDGNLYGYQTMQDGYRLISESGP